MKRGFLLLLALLSIGLLASCKPEESEKPPIDNGGDKEVIKLDYLYELDGTLSEKARKQSDLLEENLRLFSGDLAENGTKLVRANLWTYSAYFTTVNQLYMMDPNPHYKQLLDLASEELEWYVATHREDDHLVYASKNGTEEPAFFDDNVWLVIGWINGYNATGDEEFLDKAIRNMDWIYSGWQQDIGGIFWREFPDSYTNAEKGRNTCINGPAAWASAMLYEITGDIDYLDWSIRIYNWTKRNLYDNIEKVFWDNIDGDGFVNKWTFTYNHGTMLSAAAYLYNITKEDRFKDDVSDYMEGAEKVFYEGNLYDLFPHGEFYKDNPWFRVYLVQGFFDAMRFVDPNYGYRLERVKAGILFAYDNHFIDETGFIFEDWSGRIPNEGAGSGFNNYPRTLFVVGNIEILTILAQYEAYIIEVTQ